MIFVPCHEKWKNVVENCMQQNYYSECTIKTLEFLRIPRSNIVTFEGNWDLCIFVQLYWFTEFKTLKSKMPIKSLFPNVIFT